MLSIQHLRSSKLAVGIYYHEEREAIESILISEG